MRVWDRVEPSRLCRQHLLGEHREVHCIWTVLDRWDRRALTAGTGGYTHHPEVRRWREPRHRAALYVRHARLVEEMLRREYNHRSPLPEDAPCPEYEFPPPWDDQAEALRAKGCGCRV